MLFLLEFVVILYGQSIRLYYTRGIDVKRLTHESCASGIIFTYPAPRAFFKHLEDGFPCSHMHLGQCTGRKRLFLIFWG